MEEIKVERAEEVRTPIVNEFIDNPVYTYNREEQDRDGSNLVSCLKNEKIIARYIMKQGKITNPKHVLYGGMAENAVKIFTVPILSSGLYVNVLTDKEKEYLEYIMGLDKNSLSVYKKKDNFWDNFQVRLMKQDNYFDLRNPEDYIKYKVLLANKELIAPSLQDLEDRPKATYKYVLIAEEDSNKSARKSMSVTMEAYKLFGKIEDDAATLRVIIELMTQKSVAAKTKLEFLHTQVNSLIQLNTKHFVEVAKDEFLPYKVIIKRGVEEGLIANRGGFYYVKSTNTPMCKDNEDPTINSAARWLALPKQQELKFGLEAKINESK